MAADVSVLAAGGPLADLPPWVFVLATVVLAAAVCCIPSRRQRGPTPRYRHVVEDHNCEFTSGRQLNATTVRWSCMTCFDYRDMYDPPPRG